MNRLPTNFGNPPEQAWAVPQVSQNLQTAGKMRLGYRLLRPLISVTYQG
jgi:hypothetical protein